MPWFMTVFGRDTLITSYQTLLLGPELAVGALDVLAELQATEDDPTIDAEPGKIVHEVRHGKAAEAWFRRYYGTVDATPLYLVLLSEVWRWTRDDGLVRRLRDPALQALGWIDSRRAAGLGGFISYERRTDRGLENQSWKDSGDSQRFADGRIAEPPIAAVEVQGYAYDAKLRAAELAREVWAEPELAERLESEARDLQQRFDEAYWTGDHYALALDRDGARVDSHCSNVGHLLWSGIVPEERVDSVVAALMDDVRPRRRVQPALVPQRNGLASRQLPDRGRPGALRPVGGGGADRPRDDGGVRDPRAPAAGGVRRPAARRDAVPDRLPDRGAAAGVGGRNSDPAAPGAARSAP
jgi:glycogen debranching enzyme